MSPRLLRLMLIADRCTSRAVQTRIIAAINAGAGAIQLRDHRAMEKDFTMVAERVKERLRDPNGLFINSRMAIAHQFQAGLHLGRTAPSMRVARTLMGEDCLIGYSAHSIFEGRTAVREGANYLIYSPIFPTRSKPGHPGVGLKKLATFCEAIPEVPVFALGGITPDRVAACREAGAYGIAVVSGVFHAPDTRKAVEAYLAALSKSQDSFVTKDSIFDHDKTDRIDHSGE